MTPTQSQNCPLCTNPAEYEFVDFQNRKHFLCANCTEFQISTRAETRLTNGPAEWKAGLAKLAKAHPVGSTLVITLPSGPRPEGIAYPALVDEYVKNSELPH
jgi:hypothetical protein